MTTSAARGRLQHLEQRLAATKPTDTTPAAHTAATTYQSIVTHLQTTGTLPPEPPPCARRPKHSCPTCRTWRSIALSSVQHCIPPATTGWALADLYRYHAHQN